MSSITRGVLDKVGEGLAGMQWGHGEGGQRGVGNEGHTYTHTREGWRVHPDAHTQTLSFSFFLFLSPYFLPHTHTHTHTRWRVHTDAHTQTFSFSLFLFPSYVY